MISNDKFQFFESCAGGQDYEKTRTEAVYDNSLDIHHIPHEAYSQYFLEGSVEEWYREFMRTKFNYFCFIIRQNKTGEENIANQLKDDRNCWAFILNEWRKQESKERLAYLYRITQMPKNIVVSFWYNNLSEFNEWANLCEEYLRNSENGFALEPFNKAYINLENKIQVSEEILLLDEHVRSFVQENIVKGLTSSASLVFSGLSGHSLINIENIEYFKRYFQLKSNESQSIILAPEARHIIEELPPRFLDMVSAVIYEEEYYLKEFLLAVKEAFKCELCDYLKVSSNERHQLELVTTTVDLKAVASQHPEKTENELRQELVDNQSYSIGEGISGSILLCPFAVPSFHVGTNNLSEDPRRSILKQELYEIIYSDSLKAGGGKIRNFWVFPIYNQGKLVAAFRVVNRLDENGKLCTGGWPLALRLQLCFIVEWFQKLWLSITSDQRIKSKDLAAMVKEWQNITNEFVKQLDLSWVTGSFISKLLQDLERTTIKRIETRTIGCSVVIVNSEEMSNFCNEFKNYPTIELKNIKKLSDVSQHYDDVSPDEAAFVFDQEGKFKTVINLDKASEHAVGEITKDYTSVAFLVERDHHSILVFRKGELAAERFLNESIGAWQTRYYAPLIKKVTDSIRNISNPLLERVCKVAWYLSYEHPGAMIIVGGDLQRYFEFQKTEIELHSPVSQLTDQRFMDFAKKDGAVLITNQGIVYKAGVILKPKTEIHLSDTLDAHIKAQRKGGRHSTGVNVSCACRDAFVIVVSQNRGISILYNASALEWDF